MMGARWLRCGAVLVAVVVLAAACGGEPEPSAVTPESEPGGAAELSVPSVGSGSVVGGRSPSGLDLERLALAVATLDPDAVCPGVVAPASFDDVVEVGRIDGGCALIEYVELGGRSLGEVRAELGADRSVFAVSPPAVDLELVRVAQRSDVASLAQWHLEPMDADQLWLSEGWTYISGRRGVPGWPDGEEVIVAVIDTGVDGSHRDLGANVLQVGDACHRTPSHPHGTHVAGIIAAVAGNRRDVAGIAPQAKILPIKVHFSADFGDPKKKTNPADPTCFGLVPTLTTAIDVARRDGADVINLSLRWNRRERDQDFVVSQVGVDEADEAPHVGRDTVEWAIEVARLQGVVVVAAAGNCGDDEDRTLDGVTQEGFKHNKCTSHNQKQVPAGYWNVIAVAATDSSDKRAAFSTANGDVEIAAPGDDIVSTVPAYVDDGSGPCGAGVTCHVAEDGGTSMAAPMVAGVAAHMKARYGDIDPGLVTDAIFSTARAPSGVAAGSVTHEYGAGIIDPAAALEALDQRIGTPLPPPPLPEIIPGGSDQAVITIAAGADAQGAPGPNGAPCTSEHCRYVEISLTNVPTGDYTVECYSSANPNQPWHTATWHWPNNTQWTQGGCAYNTPGHQIWAIVSNPHGTLTTEPITWPTTTPPPAAAPAPPAAAPAPPARDATFSAVSAGGFHSCGLRTDGTITCWGGRAWDFGQTEAPGGVYSAVSAGWLHSCGLRSDGTITCWGKNDEGQSEAPGGVYSAVTAGLGHACGLRSDGTITCWGGNYAGQSEAPGGVYSAVSASGLHSCGLRSDGTITCWGDNIDGQTEVPGGTYSAVSAGWLHACGLRSDGTITCWGSDWQTEAPGSVYSAVSAGQHHRCGLRSDGTITCWGDNLYGQTEVPGGTYSAVSAGGLHSCGLRSDGTITCWGSNYERQSEAPGGGEEPIVEPTTPLGRSVVLSRGGPGPTAVGEGQGVPCAPASPTCRYLDVELAGFAPGIYTVSCAHDGWGNFGPSVFWTFSITVDAKGSAVSRGPCFLNFARLTGNGAYVSVTGPDGEGVTSNWLK